MERDYRLKIFLVDEDDNSLMAYKARVEDLGYKNVSCIESIHLLVDKLTDHPDVIFLFQDVDQPSELAALKRIKVNNPQIFVVVLSGKAGLNIVLTALKSGADEYIVKGFNDMKTIKNVLERVIQIKKPVGS